MNEVNKSYTLRNTLRKKGTKAVTGVVFFSVGYYLGTRMYTSANMYL